MVVVPVGKKFPGGTPLRVIVTLPGEQLFPVSVASAVPNWLSSTICPHAFVVTETGPGT
jgi:hypothetical protein